jgi:SAM-dependent methyltransferase
MYAQLARIHQKPKPFEFYTTETLWNDEHISAQMLACHLDENTDLASRNKAFVDRSVDWMVRRFEIGPGKQVCDFGCGPGLYTLRLARTGAAVTGVDFSRRSIAYARQAAEAEGAAIDYIFADYLRYKTEQRFDLITIIFCDFCVLSPVQRMLFLEKVHSLLKPGGAFLFDVSQLAAFEKRSESASFEHCSQGGFWSAEAYFAFTHFFTYPDEKVSLDQYTIVQPERTWQVFNWLQYYSVASLSDLLRGCGFNLVETYANVAGDPFLEDGDEFAGVASQAHRSGHH